MAGEWTRERVLLSTQEGIRFKGAQAETRNGLAVHRRISDPSEWNVTHIASGMAIAMEIRTLANARECAEELLRIRVDWYLGEEPLREYCRAHGIDKAVALIKAKWERV